MPQCQPRWTMWMGSNDSETHADNYEASFLKNQSLLNKALNKKKRNCLVLYYKSLMPEISSETWGCLSIQPYSRHYYGFVAHECLYTYQLLWDWFIGLACTVICTNTVQLFTVNPKKQNIFQTVPDTLTEHLRDSKPLQFQRTGMFKAFEKRPSFIDCDHFPKLMFFTSSANNLAFPTSSQDPCSCLFLDALQLKRASPVPCLPEVHYISQLEMNYSFPGPCLAQAHTGCQQVDCTIKLVRSPSMTAHEDPRPSTELCHLALSSSDISEDSRFHVSNKMWRQINKHGSFNTH